MMSVVMMVLALRHSLKLDITFHLFSRLRNEMSSYFTSSQFRSHGASKLEFQIVE